MNQEWVIGIDLGLTGAICISSDENSLTNRVMPVTGKHIDWDELKAILESYPLDRVFVVFEKLGQIYQSSKATAMSMGRQSEGMIVLCKCLGIPYAEVPPKEWQGKMFMGIDKIKKSTGAADTKAMALVKIRQLYPKLKLTFGERATKPHDGLVDSVLLCEYARRYL